MKKYYSQQEAIIDLHERGFTSDFQLFGNDLLWIQEKIFVRAGDFSILEYHQLESGLESETAVIICGILLHSYPARGILLKQYKGTTAGTPPILIKKLKEARLYSTDDDHLQPI